MIDVEALEAAIAGDRSDKDLEGIRDTAVAAVALYAPDAPASATREAVIRYVAYVVHQPPYGITEDSVGPLQTRWSVRSKSPLHDSGAAAVLAPWHVIRAGVC